MSTTRQERVAKARRRLGLGAVVATTLLLMVGSVGNVGIRAGRAQATVQDDSRPSIVLVLMDDASMNLLRTMANAKKLMARGASYSDSYVVDSLCCPSRAVTLTGQYPYQTGVYTNTGKTSFDGSLLGGYHAFADHDDELRTFAVRLHDGGYQTGFFGKYLNEYAGGADNLPPVPPGWSAFEAIFETGYEGWNFAGQSYVEGSAPQLRTWPAPPASATDAKKDSMYSTEVIGRDALGFIKTQQAAHKPYFVEVSTYATHQRIKPGIYPGDPKFPAEFRDRPGGWKRYGNCGLVDCRDLTTKDIAGFGSDPTRAYSRDGSRVKVWNQDPIYLSRSMAAQFLRDRARMAQSIDRLLGRVMSTVDPNTYVVLTSDNGLHTGQFGLGVGKGSPYKTDSQVPLVIAGPGIPAGPRYGMASNLDLAPTFEQLAAVGSPSYRSGVSLVQNLRHPWKGVQRFAFLQHTRPPADSSDPDQVGGGLVTSIPSYVAVRSPHGVLVRDDFVQFGSTTHNYWYEFYPYSPTRTWERKNEYTNPAYRPQIQALMKRLDRWDQCRAGVSGADPVSSYCRDIVFASK